MTPADFCGLEVRRSYDLAVPICSQAVLWSEGNWLNEGTTWWPLPPNYPAVNVKDYLRFKLEAVPAKTGVSALRTEYSDSLWLLLATTGPVLPIACSNLANLAGARATAREH